MAEIKNKEVENKKAPENSTPKEITPKDQEKLSVQDNGENNNINTPNKETDNKNKPSGMYPKLEEADLKSSPETGHSSPQNINERGKLPISDNADQNANKNNIHSEIPKENDKFKSEGDANKNLQNKDGVKKGNENSLALDKANNEHHTGNGLENGNASLNTSGNENGLKKVDGDQTISENDNKDRQSSNGLEKGDGKQTTSENANNERQTGNGLENGNTSVNTSDNENGLKKVDGDRTISENDNKERQRGNGLEKGDSDLKVPSNSKNPEHYQPLENDKHENQAENEPVPNNFKPAPYAANRELSDDKIKELQSIPKGNRPDPESYLSPDYVQDHKDKFDDGGSYLMPMSTYDNLYGKDSEKPLAALGRSDGTTYMMPKADMDKIMDNTGGDIDKIMDALGIDEPSSRANYDKGFVRVDVPNAKNYDLRLPSGNEQGANADWIPGGYTSGGLPEAVTNKKIPCSDAIFSKYFR